MLELKNINVWFGKNHVLKDLSCKINLGDFVIVLGTNGTGKSTFFDVIAGKIKPTSGQILLNGEDITNLSEQQRSSMITRIFQSTRLNSVGSLTVAQNLAIALYSRRSAKLIDGMSSMPQEEAEKLVHKLGMQSSILDKTMNSLSGGQRQLIAFAMATQLVPKVLLLDEPTAALDPQAATKLLKHAVQFIKRNNNVITLLITHDPQIALSIGNKIWVLERGHITKQFDEEAKKKLEADQLIGQINYEELMRESMK